MRTKRLGLLGLFLFLTVGFAQTRLPELKIDAITAGSVLLIRNVSEQPLAAYLIELVDYPGSTFSLWQDEILGGEPIAPGGEKRIQITNMTVGAVPDYVKMQAALYVDGSTAGHPEKVALMMSRRKAQREVARELIRRLEAAEDLTPWADSLKPEGKPKYDSVAWVSKAAQHAFVLYFKQKLVTEPRAQVLAQVRAAERRL